MYQFTSPSKEINNSKKCYINYNIFFKMIFLLHKKKICFCLLHSHSDLGNYSYLSFLFCWSHLVLKSQVANHLTAESVSIHANILINLNNLGKPSDNIISKGSAIFFNSLDFCQTCCFSFLNYCFSKFFSFRIPPKSLQTCLLSITVPCGLITIPKSYFQNASHT